MEIRKSQPQDITKIISIYQDARAFMAQNGNTVQWQEVGALEALAEEDIRFG